MTGFGAARAERSLPGGALLAVRAEVRTVNHKHLQLKVRLPQDHGVLEPPLERLVRGRLARGAVQLSVEVALTGGEPGYDIDEATFARYVELQRTLAARHGLEAADGVEDLLTLPGVVVPRRASSGVAVDGQEAAAVLDVVGEALDRLVEMRAVEGEAMERDLRVSAAQVVRLLGEIEERVPEILVRHRARLVERVRDLAGDASIAEADLAREVALLADRLDVAEEIARLRSHVDQLDALLAKGGAIGRKLDFLAQEFFREANTIGSKCSDSVVAHLVVDLKTQVERLREQVQNVE
ncbi:MAG: YicC/YloC family endoribonuclease [Planctomycetota bacterium]|nr:YicC/YloC family endoribonuclease [Planctomycetota bacterium]